MERNKAVDFKQDFDYLARLRSKDLGFEDLARLRTELIEGTGEQRRKHRVRKHSIKERTETLVKVRRDRDIVKVLTNPKRFPSPVRPVGSNSASTRCLHTQGGTRLDMTSLNRLIRFNAKTVMVQAGIRLCDLAERLAEHGLELVGSCDDPDRTVGGAISSGSPTAAIPGEGGNLASSVVRLTLITPQGHRMDIGKDRADLLRVALMSYGWLGVICEVELRIRRIRSYAMRNKTLNFDDLAHYMSDLAQVRAAVKLYLLPYRDTAFVEVRVAGSKERPVHAWPWKIRNWAWNSVLPRVVHSVGRVMPISRIRNPLIDTVNEAAQVLVNRGLSASGSNSAEQSGQFRTLSRPQRPSRIRYCTWAFPACQFGAVVKAYRDFCRTMYKTSKFHCDLPAVAYRIDRDQSALLSPSFDEQVFSLSVRTTDTRGWEDFLIEFAKFASGFAGIPLFNQTCGISGEYVADVFGKRLAHVRAIRRRLDPTDRMLNQFFAEHVG